MPSATTGEPSNPAFGWPLSVGGGVLNCHACARLAAFDVVIAVALVLSDESAASGAPLDPAERGAYVQCSHSTPIFGNFLTPWASQGCRETSVSWPPAWAGHRRRPGSRFITCEDGPPPGPSPGPGHGRFRARPAGRPRSGRRAANLYLFAGLCGVRCNIASMYYAPKCTIIYQVIENIDLDP